MKQFFQARYGFALFLAVVTLGIYLPGLQNTLLFDDNLLKNGTIFSGYGSLTEFKQRMLSYGSFVWLEGIFGEGWWKQRLFNIAIHLANIFAIHALISRILAHAQFSGETTALPHFTASRSAASQVALVIFALNPVAVYAVAYLIQRSILMATLFSVVACWAFVRWLESRKPGWIALAVCAYIVAILSKEYALATLVLMVPIYIFIRRPNKKTLAIATAIALSISGMAAAMFFHIYGHLIGKPFDGQSVAFVQQLESIHPGVSDRIYPLSILNEAALFIAYGVRWVLPYAGWMSVDLRPAFPLGFASPWHLAGALLYVGLGVAALWAVLQRRDIWSAVGLFTLFPVLWYVTEFSTVWIQDPFVLYRSYLWAVALPGLLAIVLTGLKPRTIYTLGIVLGLALGALAFERAWSLKDEGTAWQDAAEKVDLDAPANAVGRSRAFINLGSYYLRQRLFDQAERHFKTALSLNDPGGMGALANLNMGATLQHKGQHVEALKFLAAAQAMGNRSAALSYHIGESQLALGQIAPALANLGNALAQLDADPINRHLEPTIRQRRAEAALAAQQFKIAIDDYRDLLARSPNDAQLSLKLGIALGRAGQSAEAMELLNKLIAQSPSALAFYGRAMVHYNLGERSSALGDLDQAIALDPRNAQYRAVRNQLASPPPAPKR